MAIENLSELFVHTLREIYHAESQVKNILPKMINRVADGKLRGVLEIHLDETEEHIARLEKAFKSIGEDPGDERCLAFAGILDEVEELVSEIKNADTRDNAMIATAQTIEHYEIARYQTLCVWAQQLGHAEARYLLEGILSEEVRTNGKLMQIAESKITSPAML